MDEHGTWSKLITYLRGFTCNIFVLGAAGVAPEIACCTSFPCPPFSDGDKAACSLSLRTSCSRSLCCSCWYKSSADSILSGEERKGHHWSRIPASTFGNSGARDRVHCNEMLSTELVSLKQKDAAVFIVRLLLSCSAKFPSLKIVRC